MCACALALTAAALGSLPADAGGAAQWVVKGRGFGHGVGMSQYGAYGYARKGRGHEFIVRHYFRGTTIGTLPRTPVVRVLLNIDRGSVAFSGASEACGRALSETRSYAAYRSGAAVQLRDESGRLLRRCGRKLRATGGSNVVLEGVGPYRGALEVVPTDSDGSSLNAINALDVNQYVKGVVPHEVPYTWPMAALKAQAVVARSYALSTGVSGNGFSLYADTRSQAYGGLALETPRTNLATVETRDEVALYHGQIAQTFYSSTSGGQTESVENSFYGAEPIPYLRSVDDPFDYFSPLHIWKFTFSNAEMDARLAAYVKGRLRRIVVTRRGDSPRVLWARLHGTGGTSMIRGDTLQYALGLYDRWAYFHGGPTNQQGGGGGADSGGADPGPSGGAGPRLSLLPAGFR